MTRNVISYTLIIFVFVFKPFCAALSSEEQLIEAGCKKKDWNKDGEYLDKETNKTYDWVASGELLENGACLVKGYQP